MRNRDEMDGFMMLIRALSGEQNVIENMEAEGQQEAIRRTLLARRMYPSQADWESLGFTFIDIPDDRVMYQAELPEGWSIEATSHQMHSNILDANGHKRGSMFYKASFYDRNASMSLERRYNINRRYFEDNIIKEAERSLRLRQPFSIVSLEICSFRTYIYSKHYMKKKG